MTITLVHHDVASIHGGVSPFADAITDIVEGEDVRIACPYIGINYVTGMLGGCPSWRILTDAEEFICSNRGSDRAAAVRFIAQNQGCVRHVKDLHAKVVIGGDKALVGSANLTSKGLTGRDEMAVLFEGTEHVEKLSRWFDDLWAAAGEPGDADLRRFVESIPAGYDDAKGPTASLPSAARRVRARLQPAQVGDGLHLDARSRLVTKLRQAPSRAWADHFLDLVRELVEVTGLDDDDPRLVMSLPNGSILPVTICQRYVLGAFRRGASALSMMLPKDRGMPDELRQRVVRWGSGYRPMRTETADTAPWWVAMEVPDPAIIPAAVLDEWRRLIRLETEHGMQSSYRRFHEPIVFRSAVDAEFRGALLDEAFPREAKG